MTVQQSKQPPTTEAEKLCEHLRSMALGMEPGTCLPSVKMLCHLLNTTQAALAEALDQLEIEHVLERNERQGIFVSSRLHQKNICILFDASPFQSSIVSPFWSMLWGLLAEEARRRSCFKQEHHLFQIVLPTHDAKNSVPSELMKVIQTQRIHGVLSIGLHSFVNEWLQEQEIPCVTFPAGGYWMVQMNGRELGCLATEELIRQGCKRIGFWAGSPSTLQLEEHDEVVIMREVLKAHNIPFYPDLTRCCKFSEARDWRFSPPRQRISRQEQGYQLAREVFSQPRTQWPDGLCVLDEMLTDGALVAWEELGIEIGEDFKLVTLANVGSPILFGRTRRMAVLEYDPNDVVSALFSVIDMLLAGQKPAARQTWVYPRFRHSFGNSIS